MSDTVTAPLLTLQQVAEHLNLSYKPVLAMIRSGQLPAMKLGGVWRVDPADLEAAKRQARHKPRGR